MVDKVHPHCISFRCSQCNTTARSSPLWWTNHAPTSFHFGVANDAQMDDPAFCGGPTWHRCKQCDTHARSSSLWWTNLAPIAFHFGVPNVKQMLDPTLCGGPTLHPLYFISVWPICDTNARSSSLWWTKLAPTAFHFGVPNVIHMIDPILCGGPTLHPLHLISV